MNLHETVKAPWSSYTANGAALCGHLHILEYLVERKYNKYVESACQYAAKFGHLDCLKYLHQTARAPLDYLAVREAIRKTKPNVYDTSSTTTALYHMVGDTSTESYACQNQKYSQVPNRIRMKFPNREYNILCNNRKRERETYSVRSPSRFHLSFSFVLFSSEILHLFSRTWVKRKRNARE